MKRFHYQKGTKVTTKTRIPKANEGSNGDLVVVSFSGNISLYGKYNNRWFPVELGADYQKRDDVKYLDNSTKLQFSQKWYTRNSYWYTPSITYGANYYNWNTNRGTSLPSIHRAIYNPTIVVPKDGYITSYYWRGSWNSNQTYELALMTGAPNYGTSADTDIDQVGTTQSVEGSYLSVQEIGEEGLSVAVSKGDIIVPFMRRTTNPNGAYYYGYGVLDIVIKGKK